MKEEIYTLQELLDLVDQGELSLKSEGWLTVYWTDEHRNIDLRGYAPIRDIRAIAAARKESEIKTYGQLWQSLTK